MGVRSYEDATVLVRRHPTNSYLSYADLPLPQFEDNSEVHGSGSEDLCKEETAIIQEVKLGRIESSLLHPTSIQTSEPDLPR